MHRLVILAVMVLGIVGCGESPPKLVSVTGKVQMKNQPVTAGSIIFHPSETNAFAKDKPSSLLQLDGSFTMKTFPFGDGVSIGKYKVTVSPEVANRYGKPLYADPLQTPWSVEIDANGKSDLVFEIK